jgi:hypothetical protein
MATYRSTTRTDSNGLAVAGLVCGIVGIFLFNIILGPLAIIFGSIGLSRANHGAPHRTMSIWAIALGIVALVLFIALIAVSADHHFSYHVG